VDVICFRYWWETDKGLFAPKGGQSLSPRQGMRLSKFGAPNDENLAAMAAEYRGRAPGKVVIAQGEDSDLHRDGWAFVCAGGSLPNLPKGTDARLLAAIPRMQPCPQNDVKGQWVLREAGRQYLVYAGPKSSKEIDLTGESGKFVASVIDQQTGAVSELPERIAGGGKARLPDSGSVFWLKREE
jgi:hypothetical protein